MHKIFIIKFSPEDEIAEMNINRKIRLCIVKIRQNSGTEKIVDLIPFTEKSGRFFSGKLQKFAVEMGLVIIIK